jgi:hypothetical protein
LTGASDVSSSDELTDTFAEKLVGGLFLLKVGSFILFYLKYREPSDPRPGVLARCGN